MLLQNTYTDIVDTILKYLKQIKGSPADLVSILDFVKQRICAQVKQQQFPKISQAKVDEREGSKILKLVNFYAGDETSLLVEFHLKLLYSAHKNKKAPAYMLKSVLVSLDGVHFDRLKAEYKQKALEVLKLLKPNCYQIMIDIFGLGGELAFFKELATLKIAEQKYRDVVVLKSLFPDLLDGPQFAEYNKHFLMRKLIEQNDVTTARLLIAAEAPRDDQVFLIQQQFNQVRNAKKAAMLIKEFDLDLDTISQEFYHIEEIIVRDSMNFYLQQFGVSFKHYSMDNTIRLADYLVDFGP
jgi:hypothetical protein